MKAYSRDDRASFDITRPEEFVCDVRMFAAKNLSAAKVKVHDRWKLLIDRIPKEQVAHHP